MSDAARTYPGAWHTVADFLASAGVDTIFGLPSDALLLLAAVRDHRLRMVLCRDQRNAAFAATGYALQTGRPAVLAVGKGPAVTNALTGLLEASCSAAPVLVLASGTAVRARGTAAFQELDQLSVVRPLVGWAERVDHPDRVPGAVERAWTAAVAGRPGPVYLELPDHLGTAPVERPLPWSSAVEVSTAFRFGRDSAAVAALRAARRPVLLVGGGARHRNADRRIERLADRTGAAMFATASGRGTIDEAHPRFLGLSGLYLRPAAEKVWHDADLVVALGSRLEETTVLGAGVPTVLQVNLDAEDLSASFPGPRVVGDVGAVVAALHEVTGGGPGAEPEWRERIGATRAELDAEARTAGGPGGPPVARLLAALDRTLPAERVLVQENGLTDMWSYLFPYLPCRAGAGSIVPSEQTSLGFGAAAATGVAIGAPGRQVVAFVGDGAFALASADLVTAHRERAGVLYVVLCNGGYGWLQSQADQRDLDRARFGFVTDVGPPPAPADPTVHRATLDPRGDVAPVLAAALAACAQGRTAVLYVPVDLADAPPGLSEVDGDFPAPRPEGDDDSTPGNGDRA
ncbi:thiamine pyrophosphate-binding protein [Pseudonocardia sp. EV170527-09]|uniref:thiamine pyrophosphate-binding protein n=1 Tax=Pseudonocardia sp. EV170527-09 TaxID=2603411 RepID=UPI0011F100B6|nr:thiamine pyrophosphate-binding protein [Pseudonocardia sp. EV170527-09]KAA1033631.1 thiamine pyrophosphate-binding protein [Pseudonocardia sp. EV170527-09]